MNEYEVIRGKVNGEAKYCRIPIRSKLALQMEKADIVELNSEIILSMPHDQAARVIDAIMEDWLYWLRRSGEMFIRLQALTQSEDDYGSAVSGD